MTDTEHAKDSDTGHMNVDEFVQGLTARLNTLATKEGVERVGSTLAVFSRLVGDRMKIMEAQIENMRLRLDGHDLAFVTQGLDEESKAHLAEMLRRDRQGSYDDAIGPDQEGTDGSSTPPETGG